MASVRPHLEVLRQVREGMPRPAGYAYMGMEDFVLQRGQEYGSAELTMEELGLVLKAAARLRFRLKACFENAQALVRGDRTGTLVYVEGYAAGIIPVHHAWAELNGKVIDPTWLSEAAKEVHPELDGLERAHSIQHGTLGYFGEDRAYMGVRFPSRKRVRAQVGSAGGLSLLDDWKNHWPLLKDGVYEGYLKGVG